MHHRQPAEQATMQPVARPHAPRPPARIVSAPLIGDASGFAAAARDAVLARQRRQLEACDPAVRSGVQSLVSFYESQLPPIRSRQAGDAWPAHVPISRSFAVQLLERYDALHATVTLSDDAWAALGVPVSHLARIAAELAVLRRVQDAAQRLRVNVEASVREMGSSYRSDAPDDFSAAPALIHDSRLYDDAEILMRALHDLNFLHSDRVTHCAGSGDAAYRDAGRRDAGTLLAAMLLLHVMMHIRIQVTRYLNERNSAAFRFNMSERADDVDSLMHGVARACMDLMNTESATEDTEVCDRMRALLVGGLQGDDATTQAARLRSMLVLESTWQPAVDVDLLLPVLKRVVAASAAARRGASDDFDFTFIFIHKWPYPRIRTCLQDAGLLAASSTTTAGYPAAAASDVDAVATVSPLPPSALPHVQLIRAACDETAPDTRSRVEQLLAADDARAADGTFVAPDGTRHATLASIMAHGNMRMPVHVALEHLCKLAAAAMSDGFSFHAHDASGHTALEHIVAHGNMRALTCVCNRLEPTVCLHARLPSGRTLLDVACDVNASSHPHQVAYQLVAFLLECAPLRASAGSALQVLANGRPRANSLPHLLAAAHALLTACPAAFSPSVMRTLARVHVHSHVSATVPAVAAASTASSHACGHDFEPFLMSSMLADVCLHADGDEHTPAHSLLCATASKHLHTRLVRAWGESQTCTLDESSSTGASPPRVVARVAVPGVQPAALRTFLTYTYTHSLRLTHACGDAMLVIATAGAAQYLDAPACSRACDVWLMGCVGVCASAADILHACVEARVCSTLPGVLSKVCVKALEDVKDAASAIHVISALFSALELTWPEVYQEDDAHYCAAETTATAATVPRAAASVDEAWSDDETA